MTRPSAAFRLLKSDKEVIKNKAMDFRFKKPFEDLRIREERLLYECYDHAVPAEVRRHVKKLPREWVGHNDCAKFNVGGRSIQFCNRDFLVHDESKKVKAERIVVPHSYSSWEILGEAITDQRLVEKVDAYLSDKKELEELKAKTGTSLGALLDKCNTVKALKEAWPEGERFWKDIDFEGRTPTGVPAIAMETLNKELGLSK